MTTKARIVTRSAPLWEEFGLNYATRLFGAEALTELPRYKRGPKTGRINAWLVWEKCESGGWDSRRGCVVRPNELVCAWIAKHRESPCEAALRGSWLGRMQPLGGVGAVLGEKNREREMARQAVEAADRARHNAEIDAELAAARTTDLS